jgi:adenylosuccinate synthase
MTPQPSPRAEADSLSSLGLQTGHCAVVGLQWGDEGKGKVVDLLAGRYDLVVRYNGGANAGHSVQVGDKRYALHLIPSGILSPDAINVLGNGVVIDPAQVVKEINTLSGEGIKIGDNLKISDRAHLVFEYHKVQDVLYEQAIAKTMGDDAAIGTTGRGIGPCYADKALRSMAIRVGDLKDEKILSEKLTRIVAIKNTVLAALAKQCGQLFEPFDAKKLLQDTLKLAEILRPHICDSAHLLHGSMDAGKRLLFEGANATLLDIDHGTYPFVTSSNCSSLGVHTGTGIPGHKVTNVLGIVKAYQTRVGGGPMPTELHDATGDRIREVGKEYGTTTGRPRRVGWLDLVALKYTAQLSGATGIALMLMDVLAGMPELKLCTGYKHNGKMLENFPADAAVLDTLEPVYEAVPGFGESVEECRHFDDLPDNARAYVRRIEEFVGVPVVLVSVGPRRDQTVLRD